MAGDNIWDVNYLFKNLAIEQIPANTRCLMRQITNIKEHPVKLDIHEPLNKIVRNFIEKIKIVDNLHNNNEIN